MDTLFTASALRPGEKLQFASQHVVVVLEGAIAVQRRLFGGTASERRRRSRASHLLKLLNNSPSTSIVREPPQHCFQTSTVCFCSSASEVLLPCMALDGALVAVPCNPYHQTQAMAAMHIKLCIVSWG
jgi:hypothetical protein